HQMWAAQYYQYTQPRTYITSGGLGTMGYGFPAAIGVKVGNPNKNVVCISGDGSFQMNIQEIATALKENIAITVVLMNNGYLGMVRQWQEFFYDKAYSDTDMMNAPDFVKLAEAYGAKGFTCEDPAKVESTLKQGLETPGTVIMEFIVEREESVYPMVPAGGAITDMLLV
ncbi:MAG: acetolactate synthase large subunit, partial [Desulfobacula sp.]|nr:acetolactate synthase large subunit [Desulfobacula sp.]